MALAGQPGRRCTAEPGTDVRPPAGEARAGDAIALPVILLEFRDGTCCGVDAQSPLGRALRALADVLALRPQRPAAGAR
jgi:hypothetical protein